MTAIIHRKEIAALARKSKRFVAWARRTDVTVVTSEAKNERKAWDEAIQLAERNKREVLGWGVVCPDGEASDLKGHPKPSFVKEKKTKTKTEPSTPKKKKKK